MPLDVMLSAAKHLGFESVSRTEIFRSLRSLRWGWRPVAPAGRTPAGKQVVPPSGEQRAMERIALCVGLDYHQDSVQVCILDKKGRVLANRRCPNDGPAIARAVARHGRPGEAAMWACAGAADWAEDFSRAGWQVSLAHPGYVARMKGSPDKTDFSDARLLADLVRVGYLPRVWLAPREVRELRLLVRHREQLARQRRAVKLRVRA